MVLDTTYFLGREKTGDAFHFFELQLVHIAAGLRDAACCRNSRCAACADW